MSQANQRLLKRIYLLDLLPTILRDAIYHRSFEEDEKLPGEVLWIKDTNAPAERQVKIY